MNYEYDLNWDRGSQNEYHSIDIVFYNYPSPFIGVVERGNQTSINEYVKKEKRIKFITGLICPTRASPPHPFTTSLPFHGIPQPVVNSNDLLQTPGLSLCLFLRHFRHIKNSTQIFVVVAATTITSTSNWFHDFNFIFSTVACDFVLDKKILFCDIQESVFFNFQRS